MCGLRDSSRLQSCMPPDSMKELLENAEAYREVIVKPVVDALESKIDLMLKPIADKQTAQEGRLGAVETKVSSLQSMWGKVLISGTVWSSLIGIVLGIFTSKIRKWLGI